jgi:hypothetical protein
MRILTISFYFIFAIFFLASIGVSLPYIFDYINKNPEITKNLNQNIVTYFIAILVSSSLDYVMKLIDKDVSYKKLAILAVCIANTTILFMSAYILYTNSKGNLNSISLLAIMGILVSYVMWWIANYHNSAFNITAALGGNTNTPLQNGR